MKIIRHEMLSQDIVRINMNMIYLTAIVKGHISRYKSAINLCQFSVAGTFK